MGLNVDVSTEAEREVVTQLHPRMNFKDDLFDACYQGLKHRPQTAFGNVKSDVLADRDPDVVRANFADKIRNSDWPE